MNSINSTKLFDTSPISFDAFGVVGKLNRFLETVKLDGKHYSNNQFQFFFKAGQLNDSRLGVEVVAPKHLSTTANEIHWGDYRIVVELNNEPVAEAYFSEFHDTNSDIKSQTKLVARAVFPETITLEPGLDYTLKIIPRIDPAILVQPASDADGNSNPRARTSLQESLHQPVLIQVS